MNPSNVYRLKPDAISHDLIQALEQLTAAACAGTIDGIAFMVRGPDHYFYVNAAGSAREDPHVSRGFVVCLLDELRKIAEAQLVTQEGASPVLGLSS